MSTLTLFLFSFCIATARADSGVWTRLTSKTHPTCGHENPCRILEANGSFEVYLVTGDGNSANQLLRLEIRNLKNNVTQPFSLNEVNLLAEGEFFELYKVDFSSNVHGLALHAYNSAHESEVYYYFIYDPIQQAFVKTDATTPKLVFDAKKGLFRTDLKGAKYKLTRGLKFEPIETLGK